MVLSQITLIIEDFNSRSLQSDVVAETDLTEAMIMFTPSTKEESAFNTQWIGIKVTMDISPTTLATSRKNTMTTREGEVVRCVAEVEETKMLGIISIQPSNLESITTTQPTSPDTTIIKSSRKIVDTTNTMRSSLHVEGTLVPEECAPCPIINPNMISMSVDSSM
jgi:hypothetical protein